MAVKLSSVKANLEVEATGEWVDYPDWPGVSFNVNSLHAPAYQTARDLLIQRLTRKYKGQPIPQSALAPEIGKIYCQHILRGWKGFDEEYTSDVALQRLSDPSYRNLVAAVEWCAGQVGQSDIEFIEGAEKNSARPSAGV